MVVSLPGAEVVSELGADVVSVLTAEVVSAGAAVVVVPSSPPHAATTNTTLSIRMISPPMKERLFIEPP